MTLSWSPVFQHFVLILDTSTTDPIVQCILTLLTTCSQDALNVSFIWVPGHTGIGGILAIQLPRVNPKFFPTSADLTHFIRLHVTQLWNVQWQNLRPHNKLAQFKQLPTPWATATIETRRQEIILTRLRIGHTRIIHTHLISHLFSLLCPSCNSEDPLSVEHMFTCLLLTPLRNTYKVPHNHLQTLANDFLSISHIHSPIPPVRRLLHRI